MWFSRVTARLTISQKLVFSFTAILVLVILMGYGSLAIIRSLGASLNSAVNSTARKLELATGVHATVCEMQQRAALAEVSLISGAFLADLNLGTDAGTACKNCHTADQVDADRNQFSALSATASKKLAELAALAESRPERDAVAQLTSALTEWQSLYPAYLSKLAARNISAAHDLMLNRIDPLVQNLAQGAGLVETAASRDLAASRDQARVQVSQSFLRAAATALLCLLVAAGGLVLVRVINRILKHSSTAVMEMARGVSGASAQIARASTELASTASGQSGSLEIASASSQGIRFAATDNADSLRNAFDLAADIERQLATANQILHAAVHGMAAIGASSGQISKIVRNIDEIAFQTNLLALNAAIEAARAGEAGASFGIVAGEVRSLAHRSAEAARESAELIEQAQSLTRDGAARLDSLAESIQTVSSRFAGLHEVVTKVNRGAAGQAEAVDGMTRGLTQLEESTQTVAACAEENAAAAEELSAQTELLKAISTDLQSVIG